MNGGGCGGGYGGVGGQQSLEKWVVSTGFWVCPLQWSSHLEVSEVPGLFCQNPRADNKKCFPSFKNKKFSPLLSIISPPSHHCSFSKSKGPPQAVALAAGQKCTHCLHPSPPLSERSCWSTVKPAATILCHGSLQLFLLPSPSEFQTTHFPVHRWTYFLGVVVCYSEAWFWNSLPKWYHDYFHSLWKSLSYVSPSISDCNIIVHNKNLSGGQGGDIYGLVDVVAVKSRWIKCLGPHWLN